MNLKPCASLMLAACAAALAAAPDARALDYDPAGRRDPFVREAGFDRPGDVGTFLATWQLTSIVLTPRGAIATLEGGVDDRAVFVRVGSAIGRGTVRSIDARSGVVVVRFERQNPLDVPPHRDLILSLKAD